MAWGFAVFGPLIMLLGAYVAGGTTVVCTRTGAPAETAGDARPEVIGSCRVQTTRWFGRKVVEERTYPRVTGVDRIAVAVSSSSSSRQTDSWSLQLMSRGVEVERIGAPRDRVDPAFDAAQSWFAGATSTPLAMDFTEWRFAYASIGFGTLWLGALTMIGKSGTGALPSRRLRRRRRAQPSGSNEPS
jgi:hypothetical protein